MMALRRAPAGDPTVYSIDGMEIALRRETADAIRVRSSIENDSETGADRGKTDAEADRIAAKNDQIQREVHEFAGAIR